MTTPPIKPTIPGQLPDIKDLRVVTPQEIAENERARQLEQARAKLADVESKFAPPAPARTSLEGLPPDEAAVIDPLDAPDPFSVPRPRPPGPPATGKKPAARTLDEFYGFKLPDGVDNELLARLEAKAGLRSRKLFELKWSNDEGEAMTFMLRAADYDDWQVANRTLLGDRDEDEQVELPELVSSTGELLACLQVVSIDDNLIVDVFGYGPQCREAVGLPADAKLPWLSVPRGYAAAASLRMNTWLRTQVDPTALIELVAFATKVRSKQATPVDAANPT